MPNKVKYNPTGNENAIFKGNWAIDTSPPNTGGGPSSVTGFYNGADAPEGGYVIYEEGAVRTIADDTELTAYVASKGGDGTNINTALAWVAAQDNSLIVNKTYDQIPITNLILNWDAEDLNSTQYSGDTVSSVKDLTGNNNNASATGNIITETVDGIRAWRFTSDDDGMQYFNFGTTPTGFTGGAQLSFEATIRAASSEVTAGDRGTIIVGNAYMSWNKGDRRLSSYWYSTTNRGYHEAGAALSRERWYHWAQVWTGTEFIQYVDGVEINRVSTTTNLPSTFNRVRVGAESLGRQFNGHIGRIRIWNGALTQTEVEELAQQFINRADV